MWRGVQLCMHLTEPESADSRTRRRHRRLKDDRRPTTWRVTGPQSSAIDQPLEFPINLPSDTFPVCSSIGGWAGVTAERWPIRQEGSGNLRTSVYLRLIRFHQTPLQELHIGPVTTAGSRSDDTIH